MQEIIMVMALVIGNISVFLAFFASEPENVNSTQDLEKCDLIIRESLERSLIWYLDL